MPGFSFPAPRSLESIIKYALLAREPPAVVKEVWNAYHDPRLDAVGSTWSAAEYAGIAERKRRCPRFVYPILKGDGKYFNLIAEWQDNFCIFAYLDEYKRSPGHAEPWLSVALYPDFVTSKGVVLVRGDYSGHLTKADATHALNLMRHFYFTDPRHVETFNKDPAAFDWGAFMNSVPAPPKKGEPVKLDRETGLV